MPLRGGKGALSDKISAKIPKVRTGKGTSVVLSAVLTSGEYSVRIAKTFAICVRERKFKFFRYEAPGFRQCYFTERRGRPQTPATCRKTLSGITEKQGDVMSKKRSGVKRITEKQYGEYLMALKEERPVFAKDDLADSEAQSSRGKKPE